MQLTTLLTTAATALLYLRPVLAEIEPGFCPSNDPSCTECNLACYSNCPAPLSTEQCYNDCLLCRRESSSCAWVRTDSSPDCDACADSCVCTIGHVCNPTPVPTGSGSAGPAPTGAGSKMRDLFGGRA
ncbi:hypothetical protein SLS62_008042 [Diatrype stigma]|uniref:Uncharacterized protein n=1 Tax=Diatrype stigma TaxID=117547 RepID=A0AAN9YQ61_9PEZI